MTAPQGQSGSASARESSRAEVRPAGFVEPRMVSIPEGWFGMGCEAGRDDEKPAHRVWVDAFELAACQITTRAEYASFLVATGRPAPPFWSDANFQNPQQPVVGPSWFDAAAFCEWLSQVSGRIYRLPSEGRNGSARRAEKSRAHSMPGATLRRSRCPTMPRAGPPARNSSARMRQTLSGFSKSGDNVHEWCADWYDPRYYEHSPERNPRGPEEGSRRSSRGGSWRHHIKASRCSARSSIPPQFKYADYGFRVAR